MGDPEPLSTQRLYGDLAYLWPLISPAEEYAGEAADFTRVIQQYSRGAARTLLDLGCGGGHIDFHLNANFAVSGVDLSEAMLAQARTLNPEIEYLPGDLRSIRLGRLFDAVMIADAIEYMLNEEDLLAAFRSAYAHLRPGGVFATYAEFTTETFEQNATECDQFEADGVQIALLMNRYDPDPQDSSYELTLVYLLREAGRQQVLTDRHRLGIFPLATWPRLMEQAGFSVHLERGVDDLPMFVGIKNG